VHRVLKSIFERSFKKLASFRDEPEFISLHCGQIFREVQKDWLSQRPCETNLVDTAVAIHRINMEENKVGAANAEERQYVNAGTDPDGGTVLTGSSLRTDAMHPSSMITAVITVNEERPSHDEIVGVDDGAGVEGFILFKPACTMAKKIFSPPALADLSSQIDSWLISA
jgi:hypothetical protein